ncbi:hypothetical protein PCHDS_000566600, partial [Plasmodium chabaudi adami]
IEEYNKNVKSELDKSAALIKTINENSNLETCKSKIETTVDAKDVNECIKKMEESKNYILNEESNNDTYFKNAKENNENASLLFKNIEMADNKVKYIMENKKDNDTSDINYNIDDLKENMDKSKKYTEEADQNAKQTEKNKILFEQYKKDVTELLDKYSKLAIKNNIAQTKKDSNIIINEIKALQKQESNNDTYFKNAKENNENASLLFKNIEMADNKVKYIMENKKDNDTSDINYNIDDLKENMDKSKKYTEEADQNAKQTEKNKILFEQYKKDVTELLDKYSKLAIKNN